MHYWLFGRIIRRFPKAVLIAGLLLMVTSAPVLVMDVAQGNSEYRVSVTTADDDQSDVQFSDLPSRTQRVLETATNQNGYGGAVTVNRPPKGVQSGTLVEFDHYTAVGAGGEYEVDNTTYDVPEVYNDENGETRLSNTYVVSITEQEKTMPLSISALIRFGMGLLFVFAYFDTHRD